MHTPQSFRRHAAQLSRLGLPLVGSQLAQIAIIGTDTLMLGWYGVTELAAMVLAQGIWFAILVLGGGIAYAVMPMVAASAEAGDEVQVRRVTRMGLWASALYAAAVVPPLTMIEPLLLAMGQAAEVARLAEAYLRIAAWALFPALGFMVLRSYLAALDRAGVVLAVTIVAVALNALLDWLLIFGVAGLPELGITGAAIATLGMQAGGVALLAVVAARARPDHDLFRRLWRPDFAALSQVLRLGLPIGLTNIAEVGLFSASAFLMGLVSTQTLAAHGIALQIVSTTFMVHVGLSQAATVHAGRAFGRRDREHLRRGALVALAMSAGMVAATVTLFLGLPEPLIGLFLDPDEPARPQIVAIGVALLAAAALFQAVDAAQVMALGLLRGVQDTRVPMIFAILSYWVIGFPASWLLAFPAGLGGVGVWLGLALGLATAGVTMMHRFWTKALPAISLRTAPGAT